MNDRATFPFVSLLAVSLLGILVLPSAKLSLAYDTSVIARGAAGAFVFFLAISAANELFQRTIKDYWAVCFATIASAVVIPIAIAADPRLSFALAALAALGVYFIIRGPAAVPKAQLALGALLFGLALLLFPVPDSSRATGAFLISALDGPDRSPDWLYHRTLIASILRYGVASTGLDGIVPDAYHVGGHFFLAGIMRIVGAGPDTSPIALTYPSIYLLNLFSLMLLTAAFFRHMRLAGPALGMLATAITWVVLERLSTWSGVNTHMNVLSSGVAMPLAGTLLVFAYLSITHEFERPWPIMVAMLALLGIMSMTKISSALICYCVVGAAYGLHWLRTPKDLSRLLIACAWAILGGLLLYLAYRYVAVLATYVPPNASVASRFFKNRVFIYQSLGVAGVSFAIWIAFFWLRETLNARAAISLALLHLVGLAACAAVSVSGVVPSDGDIAYFWISLRHMMFFAGVLAISMILVRWLPALTSWQTPIFAVAAFCIAIGAYRAYSAQLSQWQQSVKLTCRTLGGDRCSSMGAADATQIIAAIPKSNVARLASEILSADHDRAVVLIDKRTGFFKAMAKQRSYARHDGCYIRGWNLFMLTGVPLKFGVSYGDPGDGLCKGTSLTDGINWSRYGYGVYRDAQPRPIQESNIKDACLTTDSEAVFVVGQNYKVAREACQGSE